MIVLRSKHNFYFTRASTLPLTNFFKPYRTFPLTVSRLNRKRSRTFNPCPPDEETVESGHNNTGKRFADATAPYTLAVEIAAGIAVCWTPTDEWDFKTVIPRPRSFLPLSRTLIRPPSS
jgi:hypothetical protein